MLGAVNDAEHQAASAMNFYPAVWLNPQLDSGIGFMAESSKSKFASTHFDSI